MFLSEFYRFGREKILFRGLMIFGFDMVFLW